MFSDAYTKLLIFNEAFWKFSLIFKYTLLKPKTLIKRQLLIISLSLILFSGCAELSSLIETVAADTPLSATEVSEGLKEALITGSKNASSILSSVNGYYGDELVKILLPEEASIIIDNLSKIPGGDKLVEDVILSINRAAEDAAKEVHPFLSTASDR